MSGSHSLSVVSSTWTYCSLPRKHLGPIQSAKECLEIVALVLAKEIICRHDVEDLNRAYQTLLRFEQIEGAEMTLRDDFKFEAKKEKASFSATLLPNIAFSNGWAIVDFPALDHAAGKVVSLGIELALKTLIKEFSPRILIIEPITPSEGRAATMIGYLDRVIDQKDNCLLARGSSPPLRIESMWQRFAQKVHQIGCRPFFDLAQAEKEW